MTQAQILRLLPEHRADLEALIEAAIARLDEWDGDPDIEPGCDDDTGQGEDDWR